MIIKKAPNEIFLELKETTEFMFGLHLDSPIQNNLGFLNLKWRVESEKGPLLIKQLSKERYASSNYIVEQEIALREQLRQFENGTLCPRVLKYKDKVIHKSPSGERFIIMEYVDGENLRPGTLNVKQMYSLGKMTGHMHNVSNDGTYKNDSVPKFIPPSVEQRLDYWKSLYNTVEENDMFVELVEIQIKATKQFNLDMINSCVAGWSHRDVWVDNILFIGDQLSSILDFDRFAFDYPELDIARAIMSGAFSGNTLNSNSAKAFLEGYRTTRNLENGVFARALYLLWYLESTWWIHPKLSLERYQVVQFQNEMIWLAKNLPELKTMYGSW